MPLAYDPIEITLRRKLLFRLLRNFDFDNPRFHDAPISDPIPDADLLPADEFLFRPTQPDRFLTH